MTITIAVDCMGGDHGPSVTVPAVLDFLGLDSGCSAILVGREAALRPLIRGEEQLGPRLRIHNASEVVEMHDAVAIALKLAAPGR